MRLNATQLLGLAWAVCMLAGAMLLPGPGGWTIDDGVKRIAASQGSGLWADSLADGPVRARLANPAAFAPLRPPFALRGDHGFAPGFSPWTRCWFTLVAWCGDWFWRLAPGLIAVALWAVMARAGIAWGFLLLPLTFYGLVPWEHALSWLLLWPAAWSVLGESEQQKSSITQRNRLLLGGGLLGLSVLLRAETVVLAGVLIGYLALKKAWRDAATLAAGTGVAIAALLLWHGATSGSAATAQLQLNLIGKSGVGAWLGQRPAVAWNLLLGMGPTWGSVTLLTLFAAGLWLLVRAEQQQNKTRLGLAVEVFALWAALYQSALWSAALPPLALLDSNSLFTCLPWVAVLLLPPYRHRPALLLAGLAIALAILLTPVSSGVHWGPRILLFAMPLLAIDLFRSHRARGWSFAVLLALTAVQTAGSAALVYARARETADRVRLAGPHLGTPVICPTMSQCVDLAPLWPGREFFTAEDPNELRRLLIELRSAGVDTVWLHVDAFDSLYVQTFPNAKPVVPYRMTVLKAGTLYHSAWRIYELAMNRGDSLWAAPLELEANRLYQHQRVGEAIAIERQAVAAAPHTAQIRSNLALLLMTMDDDREARLQVDTALMLDPTLKEPLKIQEMLQYRTADAP